MRGDAGGGGVQWEVGTREREREREREWGRQHENNDERETALISFLMATRVSGLLSKWHPCSLIANMRLFEIC